MMGKSGGKSGKGSGSLSLCRSNWPSKVINHIAQQNNEDSFSGFSVGCCINRELGYLLPT